MVSKIIKLASITAIALLILSFVAACGKSQATPTEGAVEVPKPSNAGGPGKAVDLQGDATAGAVIFKDKCVECHGEEGKGGVANPGSDEGTVPELNPIDPGLVSADAKTFATNIDLFIEHGSSMEGDNPAKSMTAFGDEKKLTDQQIADVIAYVISLNKK